MWRYRGQERPAFAEAPGVGQESVWDYPRPPRAQPDARRVEVLFRGLAIADSSRTYRVLETASPPTFYLPPQDVRTDLLEPYEGRSFCEWKGVARYYSVRTQDGLIERVAWSYDAPPGALAVIAGYVSFYPYRLECRVDSERVKAQPGRFYGGWVTSELVGPFKGKPGSGEW